MHEPKTRPAPEAVAKLAENLDGPVFLPWSEGYAEEAEGFDRSVVQHPAVIAGAARATSAW